MLPWVKDMQIILFRIIFCNYIQNVWIRPNFGQSRALGSLPVVDLRFCFLAGGTSRTPQYRIRVLCCLCSIQVSGLLVILPNRCKFNIFCKSTIVNLKSGFTPQEANKLTGLRNGKEQGGKEGEIQFSSYSWNTKIRSFVPTLTTYYTPSFDFF